MPRFIEDVGVLRRKARFIEDVGVLGPSLQAAPDLSGKGYVEEPEEPEPSTLQKYGPAAVRMTSIPAGYVAGSLAAPVLGPAGPFIGGAIGGAGGESLARYLEGSEQKALPIITAGAIGAINPAPGASIARTAAREAAINVGASAASQLAEGQNPLDSPGTLLAAGALGAAGGAVGSRMATRHAQQAAQKAGQAPLREGIEQALQPEPRFIQDVGVLDGGDEVGDALAKLPGGEVLPPVQELIRKVPTPEPETATSSLLRQAQESVTPPAGAPETSTSSLLPEAQESQTGATPLFGNQRGATITPLMGAITRGGIGAGIGATQGETPEERIKNALLGAGIGAAASPRLISQFFRRTPPELDQSIKPVVTAVDSLGKAARKFEAAYDTGDFSAFNEAKALADHAMKEIDQLRPNVDKVSKDYRLFRLVADTFVDEPQRAGEMAKVSESARVLQKYSALAQALRTEAQQEGPDGQAARVLADTLFGTNEGTPLHKVMNFWRGSLVRRVSTQVRNAGDQGAMLFTSMMDRLNTGTLEGIRTGKPLTGVQDALTLARVAGTRMKKEIGEAVHLAAREPDNLQTILKAKQAHAEKLLQKPEGFAGPAGTYLRYGDLGLGEFQENLYRRIYFETELLNGLRKQGIDPDQAFRNPDMIPEPLLAKAVNEGLKGTLQHKPSGTSLGYITSGGDPNSAILNDITQLFQRRPILQPFAPFIRYMANRLQYVVDHNPVGFTRLFTEGKRRAALDDVITKNQGVLGSAVDEVAKRKAQFNIERSQQALQSVDSPEEIAGKAITGTVMLAAGAALTQMAGGERWYMAKTGKGDEVVDMRPYATIAGFQFLGTIARQLATEGKVTMSQEDITQGMGVLGTRAGVGLTVVDMMSGRGDQSFTGVVELAADLIGMFGAGFFNPLGQTKDLVAVAEKTMGKELPEEAIQRDFRDTPASRLYGPTVNQIPFLSRMLPERASPTAEDPKHFPRPLAHFFGANILQPNEVEQAIGRLGIPRQSVYPRTGDPRGNRLVMEGMGGFVERVGGAVAGRPGFQNISEPVQKMNIKEILAYGRQVGMAHLAAEDPALFREVLLKAEPKEIQELIGGE